MNDINRLIEDFKSGLITLSDIEFSLQVGAISQEEYNICLKFIREN